MKKLLLLLAVLLACMSFGVYAQNGYDETEHETTVSHEYITENIAENATENTTDSRVISTKNSETKKKSYISAGVLAVMFAVFGGLIALDLEKRKMSSIKEELSAKQYLIPNSFKWDKYDDVLIETHVEKAKK